MVYVANIVRLLFSIYIMLIFVRVIFSWLRPSMFNPVVRFVYTLTDPYLRLFAGVKFLRIGLIDFTPILAFYLLYLLQELIYRVLLTGYFSIELFVSLIVVLLFRLVYFILFIFIIAVGLRFILDLIGRKANNMFFSVVYSMSEPAVRPIRNLLKIDYSSSFDVSVLVSLAILVLSRYLILPRILKFISTLIG